MICAIHQPNYLPWLGYFDKIKQSDILIFMDNVQYTKGSWMNRCHIKTNEGKKWLSIPILHKGHSKQLIAATKIDYKINWVQKHIKSIEANYGKSEYFEKYFPDIKKILEQKIENLTDLNITLIKKITKWLNLKTKFIKGSRLKVHGQGTDLLINMVKAAGADTYLCGGGAEGYQEDEKFTEAGITLQYQNFQHPIYHQQFGQFIPGLSIIDILFNIGKASKKYDGRIRAE